MRKTSLFKGLIMLLLIASLITYLSPSSFVLSSGLPSDIKLIVNGDVISTDVPPQIVKDRTLVPIRFVAEALGSYVEWNDAKRVVLIDSYAIEADSLDDSDSIRIYVSNKEIESDVEPQIISDRVMVPVRFIAEALGAEVGWDGANRVVSITYDNPNKPVGWASVSGEGLDGTTGGGNAKPQKVTTLEEFEKLAGDDVPRVIVISGTITTGSYAVDVGSNKTIIGENKDATIHGGINMKNVSNVIVRNINFHGFWPDPGPDDTIAARNSHHLWFDHLNVWNAGDGEMDLTLGSDYITVSWCKFWYTDPSHGHRLCSLLSSGADHDDTDMGKLRATYHHNWFADNVKERMPRLLYGKGHFYNNYYTCYGNSYCIGVGVYAAALIENNYFQNVKNPHQFMYPDRRPANITATGNMYVNTTGSMDTGACTPEGYEEVEPFTDPPYEYKLDDAEDVPKLVQKYAGPQ